MASKNFCAADDAPFGVIQSRSAYSRSKAGWRPSLARSLIATPPRRRSARFSRSAPSERRMASSTMSGRIPLALSPLLFTATSLSLLRLPRGLYPGLHHVAVVLEPAADTPLGVARPVYG